MMACRVQGKELVIEGMRKPGQRMPIRRISGGKGPVDGAPAEATMDVGIRGDVLTIVEDDERVPDHGAVESDGYDREQNAERGIQGLASEEWPCSRGCFGPRPLAGWGARLRESFTAGADHFVVFSIGKELSFPVLPGELRHSPHRRHICCHLATASG